MRLFSSNFSPYATRVRIQIRKKNLPIDICPPEPALRTPAFKKAFPLGKIPVLLLDDGQHIAESLTIMHYLEAISSKTSLLSDDALNNAQLDQLARYADLHLGPALFPMFRALLMGSEISVENEINSLKSELAKGEQLMKELGSARSLHVADIALATTMFFAVETPKLFTNEDILSSYPNLQQWWQWVCADADVEFGVYEMAQALDQFLQNQTIQSAQR
ncbi:glutathione S-transferase family protein [Thalassotalea maritima]|uniref:glutathione S-transferase family protein n=1 Tax=Thalassotalea maritima TaxID=3242416 RepID=UPI003528D7E4